MFFIIVSKVSKERDQIISNKALKPADRLAALIDREIAGSLKLTGVSTHFEECDVKV
jgi:hypothetical protein